MLFKEIVALYSEPNAKNMTDVAKTKSF